MDEKRRSRRDFLQNITIVLLSLSAAALMAQTQLYNLGAGAAGLSLRHLLGSGDTAAPGSAAAQTTGLAAPVRVAVTGAYGRYGDVALVTTQEAFRPLGSLLGEALGSAGTYAACTEAEFLAALKDTSIYYDALSPLPLAVLAETVGAAAEGPAARALALSDTGTEVRLYLWDGAETYRFSTTAVSQGDLESAVNRYELGNAVFAWDRAETDPAYAAVAPLSLLLPDAPPELPVLQTAMPLSDTDGLLTALRFNPRTNYRYPESNGTEAVVDGERSLRIRADGTVRYQGGSEAALTIDAADPAAPTVLEAATGAAALVGGLLSASGDAAPYLESVTQSGASTVLRFGYQAGGVPIRFADGSAAAEVTLTGSTVSSLTLRFRQYTASGETSLLLPLRQALAIAAQTPGAALSIGYADGGGSSVSACWLAD